MSTFRSSVRSGAIWITVETIFQRGLSLIVTIILARLLSPSEFGIVAMTTVFIAIATGVATAGLGNALIQVSELTDSDKSTAFIINAVLAAIMGLTVFLGSKAVASLYSLPELELILKVLSINIVLGCLISYYKALLHRDLRFSVDSKATMVAGIGSGLVGVSLAIAGYGVWALVFSILTSSGLKFLLLLITSTKSSSCIFSSDSAKKLLGFSWKIAVSGLIITVNNNFAAALLGKYMPLSQVGVYTRGTAFRDLFQNLLYQVVSKIGFPLLSRCQSDISQFLYYYDRAFRQLSRLCFPLFGLASALSPTLVLVVMGEAWATTGWVLMLLLLGGPFYILTTFQAAALKALGRSDLYLTLTVGAVVLNIGIVVFLFQYGILVLSTGVSFAQLVVFFITAIVMGDILHARTQPILLKTTWLFFGMLCIVGISLGIRFIDLNSVFGMIVSAIIAILSTYFVVRRLNSLEPLQSFFPKLWVWKFVCG